MKNTINPWRVLTKGVILFLLIELGFISSNINLGKINVFTGELSRKRFPSSTVSAEVDGALDVGILDSIFAAHIISRPKKNDEFRVIVLGDSAIWGVLLRPDETFPGQLDSFGILCGNKIARVYNLSFPTPSAIKDLLLLDRAMQDEPDLIIWPVTLYGLTRRVLAEHNLLATDPEPVYDLDARLDILPLEFPELSYWDKVGAKHRSLTRTVKFQTYGLIQLATGEDQMQLDSPLISDQNSNDPNCEGMEPPALPEGEIRLDLLAKGYQIAGKIPIIIFNEPMLIINDSSNRDVRYNKYYPRWAYEQYRRLLTEAASLNGWNYLDLWDMFPPEYFSDTPLHLTPAGEALLAEAIAPAIQAACSN